MAIAIASLRSFPGTLPYLFAHLDGFSTQAADGPRLASGASRRRNVFWNAGPGPCSPAAARLPFSSVSRSNPSAFQADSFQRVSPLLLAPALAKLPFGRPSWPPSVRFPCWWQWPREPFWQRIFHRTFAWPFSLSVHRHRTVLAVKGSLRRAQQRRALDGSGPF